MRKIVITPVVLALLLAMAHNANAVRVADITRIDGHTTNQLSGLGLVVGLKGSGDGGAFTPAIAPLAQMLTKMADPVQAADLSNAANVAVVSLSVTVPANGGHKGDKLDVYVCSVGAAASLKGGRLLFAPMYPEDGPHPEFPDGFQMGSAAGQLQIEDPSSPTAGVVKAGAVLGRDVGVGDFKSDKPIKLILAAPSATWTTASTIAKIINDAEGNGELLAVVKNPTTIEVTIPLNEREHPDGFISRVQRLPVPDLPTEARVQVNMKTGDLILTGDVEISPVVISHKGLTIKTLEPPVTPTVRNPQMTTRDFIALDTANQGGAKLQDLVKALDQLRVPTEDRIQIIQELYKTGKLHAQMSFEGM